jgi:hypothetical protein
MSLILDGTNGLSDVDGSAATPAIRGSDANTGVFFDADIIGFSEGGTECARFNADAQFVAAAGTALLPVITTTGDVNTGIFFPAADTIAFAEGGAEAMRIDSSGNLLVGTTDGSTGDRLAINGNMGFSSQLGPQINFYSPASTIEFVNRNSGGAKTFQWYFGASGGGTPATLSTSGVWTNSSDARGKENIADIQYGLDTVLALTPRQYDVKSDGSHAIGFVAQELVKHVPEVVHVSMTDKAGSDWYGVDYGSIAAVLVKAIQEQQAIITALTARVEALEGAQG